MADDTSDDRRVISRKEQAREQRKQAYQKAKAQRASDPRVAAMKEALKARNRERYQQAKAQRKASEAGREGAAGGSKLVARPQRTAPVAARPLPAEREVSQAVETPIPFTCKGSSALN